MLEYIIFNHLMNIDESQMYDIFSHNKLTFNFANKCINHKNIFLKHSIAEFNNNTKIQHVLLNHDVEIRKCLARNIINDDNNSWIKQNAFDRLEYLNSEDFGFRKDKI